MVERGAGGSARGVASSLLEFKEEGGVSGKVGGRGVADTVLTAPGSGGGGGGAGPVWP